MRLHKRILALLTAAILLGAGGSLIGQEGDTAPGQPAAADQQPLREETIYIPYEKLQKTFEKEGRGVFLPYEKFQELWNAARAQTQAAQPPKRPVDALINSIDNEATIADQVVNVVAQLQIEVLGQGWVKIPLRLRNSAVRAATLNDQPARIVFDPEAGYHLLVEHTEDAATQLQLQLEYSRQFDKSPGQSSVVFEAPQAPINRWRVHVPEAGMSVQIDPMIAATRQADPGTDTPDAPATTDLLAFVGAAPTVRISWNPKAEGASGLTAFATVQAEQQVVISEGVARSTVKLDYDISRSTLNQLVLEVPADQKVVNVFDRNVKRWNVENQDDKQLIQVELFEATLGKQSLQVELEQFTDATQTAYDVAAALVRAEGVGRQQGIVVARLEAGLQGEATKRSGLLQLDQKDLPAELQKTQWAFAYRYGAIPYELNLRVEKVQPRISVTELVDVELQTNQVLANWQGRFQIDDAGLFQLRVTIPAGYEVRTIQGQAIGDAAAVAVDSYHREGEEGDTWIVNLAQRALGASGLSIQLARTLNDPNLLTPTGASSTIQLPLPRAQQDDVEFAQGALVLSAPSSLRVNPADTQGLRSISFGEAYEKIPAAPRSSTQLMPVLAYSFAKGDTAFAVSAERRKPQVTVDQLLRMEIDSGVVKFQASFYYNVRYSGIKSLRIDIPATLANDIRNTVKTLRREQLSPQPDDVAEDYTAWSFAAESELLGNQQVDLVWEQKIDELGIGAPQDITVPRLIPRDVDLATGQIVISKSESIDVQPTAGWEGLIPIDPHSDLRHGVRIENAAMAFTFVDAWSLQIRATRYELEASKLTSIERALVRVVALSQGKLSVQALYRMRSARQRLAIRLPEDVDFDAQPLRINGKPVSAERESSTTISAPLTDQDLNETFVLELRYTAQGTPDQLDLPWLPDEPAVQKVYLCTYLPEKQVLLSSTGSWTEELSGTGPLELRLSPASAADEARLINEITEDNPSAASSARTFPIGKSQLFIYSTLRPEDAPEGSLSLRTMNRRMFNGLIVVIIAVAGLPLFRGSLRLQLALLLMLQAALLLIGVFVPELARSILTSVFPFAIILLILIWLIGHVMRLRVLRRGARAAAGAGSPFGSAEPVVATAVAEPTAGREHAPPPVASPPPDRQARGGGSADDAQSEGGQGDA